MKECKLTLTTKEGCGRLLAIFIAVILVSGLCAQFVQTDGGRIKVYPIMLDARGALLRGEIYYPACTTGNEKMPAVIVNHGGGCVYGTMKNMAQELARRGFVVFNVSAYGSGLSAQPDYDDAGQGINGFYQSLSVVEEQAPPENISGGAVAIDDNNVGGGEFILIVFIHHFFRIG